jgi:hypothetical protein
MGSGGGARGSGLLERVLAGSVWYEAVVGCRPAKARVSRRRYSGTKTHTNIVACAVKKILC